MKIGSDFEVLLLLIDEKVKFAQKQLIVVSPDQFSLHIEIAILKKTCTNLTILKTVYRFLFLRE